MFHMVANLQRPPPIEDDGLRGRSLDDKKSLDPSHGVVMFRMTKVAGCFTQCCDVQHDVPLF